MFVWFNYVCYRWCEWIPFRLGLLQLCMAIEVVLKSTRLKDMRCDIKTPLLAIIELRARGCNIITGFKSAHIILTNTNTSHYSILPLCRLINSDHWLIISTIRVSDFAFWLGSILIEICKASLSEWNWKWSVERLILRHTASKLTTLISA